MSFGAILPIYSVIFGDPAISPRAKIKIDAIIKNVLLVRRVNDIPIEQTRNPLIIDVKGFNFMMMVETAI